MEEMIDKIADVLDGCEGEDAIAVLITVLKWALQCAPTEEDRLNVIDDMVKYLKEAEYATQ